LYIGDTNFRLSPQIWVDWRRFVSHYLFSNIVITLLQITKRTFYLHSHSLMITPNKTVLIFRVYTKFCSISCVTLNNPNYGVQNPVYHVRNPVYHVIQPQLWGSKLRLPRSEPYLPRYITPFTTLCNPNYGVRNPIYHVV
jgi:hypothetical protein